jgi:hypothetical protein
MPSFKEKLKAKAEAVQVREVEAARLGAMPLDELAAMLMPAFGPDQKKADSSWVNPGNRGGTNEELLLDWLRRTYEVFPIRPKPWSLLRARVLEAVQVLEHAGLVYVLWISEQGGRHWNATEAGLAALANNDVRQRIQGSPGASAAAPLAPPVSTAERLQKLETLRAAGAITDTEYTAKRAQIIDEL